MFRLVLVIALFFAGCGGTRVEFDGASYRSGRVRFKLGPIPPSWNRVSVTDATLAFRDEPHSGSVLVNGRCRGLEDDVPLLALTNHLVMGTTEREIDLQQTVPFDDREALHTRMRAKLDGVLLGYELYVLKKDGCVYDFVYVAPPDSFEEKVEGFTSFVRGFATLEEGAVR